MIAIIDYGMGNLRSVQKAMERAGARAKITQRPEDIAKASRIILPGVGAMRPAMEKLEALGLIPAVKQAISAGKPFLGICLGLQLLFEKSNEGGDVNGLGILKGKVERFSSTKQKVPHMGWNQLKFKKAPSENGLFKGIAPLSYVYFCHSYFVKPKDARSAAATTDYGGEFVSAVAVDNIYGVQFHPEKSQAVGLKILGNFNALSTSA
ncbi:MAG: imidazole glycerol phosphate synthase subunit HisH [Candidatus Omnitrophica bacterium]|nr:imidazole glycerol phosphate synthase subunit HisH [Candidatus Omnitrophota bacterium]MBI5024062.1 imidazole glycerol phosphate synthase subunit HisH [Candidatus Omnitrophota bacterium]